MTTSRCRHCQIILLDREAEAKRCPCCKGVLRGPSPAARSARLRLGLALAVYVVGGAAVVAWFAWPRPSQPAQVPSPATTQRQEQPPIISHSAPVVERLLVSPTIESALSSAPERISVSPYVEDAVARSELLPLPEVERLPQIPAQPVVREEAGYSIVNVNSPDDEIVLKSAKRQTRMRLVGQVKTLLINSVSGEAIIDASRLQAERVVLLGRIMGKAKVLVRGKHVEIRRIVQGESEVIIDAGDGVVVLSKKGKVQDTSRVSVTAREVELTGELRGGTTRLTLSPRGVLRFRLIEGNARLEYRKSSAKDAEPVVHQGEVRGGGQLRRVD